MFSREKSDSDGQAYETEKEKPKQTTAYCQSRDDCSDVHTASSSVALYNLFARRLVNFRPIFNPLFGPTRRCPQSTFKGVEAGNTFTLASLDKQAN